jgi:RecB family exonuclease
MNWGNNSKKKVWITTGKIGIFKTCPYRYRKLYISMDTPKKEWKPNPNYENLSKNIKKKIEESSKIFRGRIPTIIENIDPKDERFDEKTLLDFERELNEFISENKFSEYKQYEKPKFIEYSDDFGLLAKPDFTININKIPTAAFISNSKYVKIKENLEYDMEHLLNVWTLRKKFSEIKRILYIFPLGKKLLWADIDEGDFENGEEEIRKFINDLSKSNFQSGRNPFCDWCDFQDNCPAWKGYPFTIKKEKRKVIHRLSYSKLDLYKRCPFAYKKVYVDKIPQKARDFFSTGTTVHNVMEEIEQLDIPLSVNDIHNIYLKKWESPGFISKEDEAEQKKAVWAWFEKYLKEIALNPFKKAKWTELYFQFPIKNKVMVNGFIDRIDKNENGKYEIIDYKTENMIRSQEDVDSDMQLTAYSWAAKKLGMEVERLSLHFVRFQKNIYTTRTGDDIERFEKEVSEWFDKIETEKEFPPKKNKYCDHCDFKEICGI